ALQADETAAPATPATPAAAPEAAAGPLEELGALNARIQARIESGPQSSDDFAPETEAFAALVEKYADDRSPEAAQLNFMHAAYTIQILRDIDGGAKILAHVAATFPETEAGQQAATVLAQFQAQQEREEAAANLVGNPAPELHFDWASEDNLKTLSDLRGKVVVLDFWATW